MEAKTIHRLLEVQPGFGRFARNESNPLDCDLLIVDESSFALPFPVHRIRYEIHFSQIDEVSAASINLLNSPPRRHRERKRSSTESVRRKNNLTFRLCSLFAIASHF
jgi:ATP-dependent exoDNAse (exonuclease V) alpha subunit